MLSFNQVTCLSVAIVMALAPLYDAANPAGRSSIPVASPGSRFTHNISFVKYADPFVTSDPSSSIIPFNRVGNLIVIKAKVDSTEGNFILDTGAPKLILNMTYFRNYPSHSEETESGGITGETRASPTMVENLSFGPIKYYRAYADRVNLGHIENSKGIKILGLLGMQLFKRFEMIIDYEKSLIYLHLINKKESSTYRSEMLRDESAYHTFPVKIVEDKLITYGEIAGKKLSFLIDTGAESNVLDSRLSNKIFEQVSITRRIMLAGSGAQKVEALYGDMKNMKIGELDIATLPVLVTNLEKMCFSYNQCLDGMLGFDFLSMHKIGFNFVKRKMYIWK
ncbi:MAG: aspartyl protease family protein [Chitinophagaceae bacterium]